MYEVEKMFVSKDALDLVSLQSYEKKLLCLANEEITIIEDKSVTDKSYAEEVEAIYNYGSKIKIALIKLANIFHPFDINDKEPISECRSVGYNINNFIE